MPKNVTTKSHTGPSGPSVFISYAREDRHVGELIYARLLNVRFVPWLDIEGINVGADWNLKIKQAIQAADVVLLIASSHSCNSINVAAELGAADAFNKPILPITIGGYNHPLVGHLQHITCNVSGPFVNWAVLCEEITKLASDGLKGVIKFQKTDIDTSVRRLPDTPPKSATGDNSP
jgi:hypothetical protein